MKHLVLVIGLVLLVASCTYIAPPDVPAADDPVPVPDPVPDPDPVSLTLEVFCSFGEPGCETLARTILPLDVDRTIFYNIPNEGIEFAYEAALATECARDHDLFVEFVDGLLESDEPLSTQLFLDMAHEAGIDGEVFESCLESSEHAVRVQEHTNYADARGVSRSPTVLLTDGEESIMIPGLQDAQLYEDAVAQARQGSFEEPVVILAFEQVLLAVGGTEGYSSIPITVTGGTEWYAWVDETVILRGIGLVEGLEPFDAYVSGGMSRVTPQLRIDESSSSYSFSFEPSAPIAGFEPQLELFTSGFEVHEHDGSLVFIRPSMWHSATTDGPRLISDTSVELVSVEEVVTRDDGPTAALLGFSYGDDVFYRRVMLDHTYSVLPGVSLDIDMIEDEALSLVASGFGFEVPVELVIGGTARVDLGIDTLDITLEGVVVDRDVQLLATLDFDGEEITLGERDMFVMKGRTYAVDTVSPAVSTAPASVRFMEADHLVRVSDGFEMWSPDGWTQVPGVDARIEYEDGEVVEVVFEQDHTATDYGDRMLDLFVIQDVFGERLISLKDAYASGSVEPQELWYWGREPGTYTIIIEAEDPSSPTGHVRETVELVIQRVHGDVED